MVDQVQFEQFTDTEAKPLAQDRPPMTPRPVDLGARDEIAHESFRRALLTPQDASVLLAPVRGGLEQVEEKMKSVDADVFAPLANAFLELIGQGGKRLRPALALLAAGLQDANPEHNNSRPNVDGTQTAPVENLNAHTLIALAAAVEMLHTATLVHDDVIDGALLRRDAPTLNASWSAGATVLAGDYMFARSAQFAAETDNVRVITIFSDTLRVIVDGEMRQLSDRNDFRQDRQAYYQRIYAKTASLYSAATEAAAVLVGLSPDRVQALKSFGYQFGMAFQIVDDILDFVGTDATLGKPVGSDLRQGTLTLPFLYYLRELPQPQKVVSRLLQARERADAGDPGILSATVQEIVQAVRASGAIEAAHQEALGFLDHAVHDLAPFNDNLCQRSLLGLCAFVVQRSS
ncbi:MAG: polyprenyl synthetase family protein [Caldilineaceae bacterium SB0664_bin_27]|uniref:Polyprenyl synthetase family protein n=1 Tax=Caldilineaceae bacterium SB0664_bin_27 TaxID=2605260 RepID=A0A6B0YSG2_9CHLR|nr:polyprenyl synthetase family protein [Caldilineaceae bacterium SB0664_bin_27]